MSTIEISTLGPGLLAVSLVVCVLVLALSILQLVGEWMTLQKMGRHDFAALIPGYTQWEFSRGAGASKGFSAFIVIFFVLNAVAEWQTMREITSLHVSALVSVDATGFISSVPEVYRQLYGSLPERLIGGDILLVASLAIAVIYFIMIVRMLYGISKSFEHGVMYTLGLIILPFIFFPVLGLSKKQVYQGPLLDREYHLAPQSDWQEVVQARIETFGSNAPLALALIGMVLGACLMTLPGLVLCIMALVRNSGEKDKPLAKGKSRATKIAAVLGILISVGAVVLIVMITQSVVPLPVTR